MLIGIEELMLVTFVLVDDWYNQVGKNLLNRTVGSKPDFSDSELLTIMLSMDFFEFSSERRYVAFLRANYRHLFPEMLTQSQYNRRARSLRLLLNELRKSWASDLGVQFENHFLLDTTPVIAVGYRRNKRHSQFRGSADYGYCAARRMHYFGYKFVLLSTLKGIPYAFELVPANTDEREAADQILEYLPPYSNVWSDKGFIGEDWQSLWFEDALIHIWTTKRENQKQQNPKVFDQLLNRVRDRIETVNDLLKEGGRTIEHTLAHTVSGMVSRIIAKITSLTFRIYLRKFFGIDTLTYTVNQI